MKYYDKDKIKVSYGDYDKLYINHHKVPFFKGR